MAFPNQVTRHNKKNYKVSVLYKTFLYSISFFLVASLIFLISAIQTPKETHFPNASIKQDLSKEYILISANSSDPLNETNNSKLGYKTLNDYIDIVLSVVTSIGIALITISATIFIFSKSALDRVNDENEYVADVVKIHKSHNVRILLMISIIGIFIIVVPIIFHAILTFHIVYNYTNLRWCIITLLLGIIDYIVFCFFFWNSCVRVETCMRKIIKKQFIQLSYNLEDLMPSNQQDIRLELIGDWQTWNENSNYIAEGFNWCNSMNQDQFIDQFQKAERLLSPETISYDSLKNLTNIVTIFQERMNTLSPSMRIEKKDLKNRVYIADNGSMDNVVDCISNFEKRVGFITTSEHNVKYSKFFESTEKIYNLLKEYCNLLISERYTRLGMIKEKISPLSNKEMHLLQFSEAYYYFFLRILAVFVSSVQIKDYSFNGASLNYANFYSSKMERISLYSASFYRTVLSRTTFDEVVMDLSIFNDIDFFCSKIVDSSLNNSKIEQTLFEHTTVQNSGFDSCQISDCKITDSDFSDCIFNKSEFLNCNLLDSSFTHSQFRDVHWENSKIKSCSFKGSIFYDWESSTPLHMTECDFSESVWTNMEIESWNLSEGIYTEANLAGIKISNTPMDSSSFIKSSLDTAKIKKCSLHGSTLQYASLFSIFLENVDLSTADLSFVVAVRAKFIENCKLNNTNCADADFSEASFNNAELISARLYNCSLTKSLMDSCVCKYLLADNMQFTFAKCSNSDFSFSSLSHSNLTKSEFIDCIFTGAWLNDLNATETIFQGCTLKGIDFTETRFVKSIFQGHDDKSMIIKNCNFSNCKFEGVSFNNVRFEGCIFDGSVFVECTVKEKQPKFKLTRQRFNKLSDSDCKLVKILAH